MHYQVRSRPSGRTASDGEPTLEYFITVPVWAYREMPKGAKFEFAWTDRGFEYVVPNLNQARPPKPKWMEAV